MCSASSNAIFDGKLAYAPALEDVLVWDVKKGEMVRGVMLLGLNTLILFSALCGTKPDTGPKSLASSVHPNLNFSPSDTQMVLFDSGIALPNQS